MTLRVAMVQLAYSDDEPMADRVGRVADLVRGQSGHDLVVLPELWSAGGFDYRHWVERAELLDRPFPGPVARAMADAARDAGVVLHAGSVVERSERPGPQGRHYWNTSLVFGADGTRLAVYRKIHRFGFGHGEPTLMEAGEDVVTVDLPAKAARTRDDAVRVGLSTCYDLRFPELYRAQVVAGATVFVVPAAWPTARVGHWSLLGRARAVENQCVVVAVNTAGTHAGVPMGGRSQVVAADGTVLAEAGEEQEVCSVDVDLTATSRWRDLFPVLADRRL